MPTEFDVAPRVVKARSWNRGVTRRPADSPGRPESQGRPAFLRVALAAGYGVVTYAAFRFGWLGGRLNVMSAGFLFLAPFAIGFIAAAPARRRDRFDLSRVLCATGFASLGVMSASALFAREPLLCLVMALPVLAVMSSLGGVASDFLHRRPSAMFRVLGAIAVLAPYLVAYAESFAPAGNSMRTVHTEIDIRADEGVIWRNITRVAEIRPEEHRFSIFHALGLPRPREAVLSSEGVGGIRDARFEQGLSFVETVTHWQDRRELRFAIEVDHTTSPPPLISTIDGSYFRVLEGRYALEPLRDGKVRLHLDSIERLSTRFNGYAGLWTDAIMHHLQTYILRIIKERCEKQPAGGESHGLT